MSKFIDYDKDCGMCEYDNGINKPCDNPNCKNMDGWKKRKGGKHNGQKIHRHVQKLLLRH